MGGEPALRELRSLTFEGIGHTYYIEQSERPEGPWIARYEQIKEIRDFRRMALRREASTRDIATPVWQASPIEVIFGDAAMRLNGEKATPGDTTQLAEAQESLELSPERLLLTALAAPDLHAEADQVMQGNPQHGVAFRWRDGLVRIWLDARTGMPTAIDLDRSYPASVFLSAWGDVLTRTYLSMWTLEPGGISYPRQWNVERNGVPYREFTVTSLQLDSNADSNSFSIPDKVEAAYAASAAGTVNDWPLGLASKPVVEIQSGIVLIPGRWNVTLIRQPDGIVVLEAPISSRYSEQVIAEAKRLFPGIPIKAVVSTADAWPHIAGIRQYVADGIPIIALDLNQPILQRMILSPHKRQPDALERAEGAKPKWTLISDKTIVGSGSNRIELYPIRSENGERMMMVYFPQHKLLYGADLVQKQPDGTYFMPEYLSELIAAIKREQLTVTRVFAMHSDVKPIRELEVAVADAKTKHRKPWRDADPKQANGIITPVGSVAASK